MICFPAYSAAAVVSDFSCVARKMPCFQSNASITSGTPSGRRPPKIIAEIGTPAGSSHLSWMMGHCRAGQQNLELGWLDFFVLSSPSLYFSPVHEMISVPGGVSSSRPSQKYPPSTVSPTLVKIEFFEHVRMAFGFVFMFVPLDTEGEHRIKTSREPPASLTEQRQRIPLLD